MTLSWLLFLLATIGAILNIKKNPHGFSLWSISNFGWISYNFSIGETAQALQYGVFFTLSLFGIWEWWGRRRYEVWKNGQRVEGECE